MNRKFALLLLICLSCACRLSAQGRAGEDRESCRQFTQAFYNWYVAKVFQSFDHKDADPLLDALDYKSHPFSRELTQGMRKVRAEEEKSHEAILDFDPDPQHAGPRRTLPGTRGDEVEWPLLGRDLRSLGQAASRAGQRAPGCRRDDLQAGPVDFR